MGGITEEKSQVADGVFSPVRLVVRLSPGSMGRRCFSQIARDLPAKQMRWTNPSWLCLKFKPPSHTSSWPSPAPRSWADRVAPRTARSFPQLRAFTVTFVNTAAHPCPGCSLQQSADSLRCFERRTPRFSPLQSLPLTKDQLFAFRQSSAPFGDHFSPPIASPDQVPSPGGLFSF